jgi:hypothetical protein
MCNRMLLISRNNKLKRLNGASLCKFLLSSVSDE